MYIKSKKAQKKRKKKKKIWNKHLLVLVAAELFNFGKFLEMDSLTDIDSSGSDFLLYNTALYDIQISKL